MEECVYCTGLSNQAVETECKTVSTAAGKAAADLHSSVGNGTDSGFAARPFLADIIGILARFAVAFDGERGHRIVGSLLG